MLELVILTRAMPTSRTAFVGTWKERGTVKTDALLLAPQADSHLVGDRLHSLLLFLLAVNHGEEG